MSFVKQVIYSDKYNRAFEYVIAREGSYVNDPDDPGGETKFGISKRSYPGLDIKNITFAQAKDIYYQDFWLPGHCEEFASDVLSAKVLDILINFGVRTAITLVQRSLCASGAIIPQDGFWGPLTLSAVLNSDPRIVLAALKAETAGQYRLVAAQNPRLNKFLKGWLNRAYAEIIL